MQIDLLFTFNFSKVSSPSNQFIVFYAMRKISHSNNMLHGRNSLLQTLLHTKRTIEFHYMPVSIVCSKILNRDSDGCSEPTLNIHCDAVNYSRFNNNVLCMQKGQQKFVGLVAEFFCCCCCCCREVT